MEGYRSFLHCRLILFIQIFFLKICWFQYHYITMAVWYVSWYITIFFYRLITISAVSTHIVCSLCLTDSYTQLESEWQDVERWRSLFCMQSSKDSSKNQSKLQVFKGILSPKIIIISDVKWVKTYYGYIIFLIWAPNFMKFPFLYQFIILVPPLKIT